MSDDVVGIARRSIELQDAVDRRSSMSLDIGCEIMSERVPASTRVYPCALCQQRRPYRVAYFPQRSLDVMYDLAVGMRR